MFTRRQRTDDEVEPSVDGWDQPEWLRSALLERRESPPPDGTDAPRHPSPTSALPRGRLTAIALAFGLGVALALAGVVLVEREGNAPSAPSAQETSAASVGEGEPVAAVARALLPSVVQIETEAGLGSGVVYDKRGLILTAAHVVAGADEVTIRLANGRRLSGRVAGRDVSTDVAVVRASRPLPPARLGVGEPVRVGQLAVAIGSPFGLSGSVTSGVVSAIDRPIPINEGRSVASMIQTDAPINPGNSGGALADRSGTVIGINDAIRTTTGANEGVGFAIPIDVAASVADALVEGRKPRVGFLGVIGTEPATGPAGALITSVQRGTPAEQAGLRRGDLVVEVDGRRVESMAELASVIRLAGPGSRVTLEVIRDGDRIEIQAVIRTQ